MTLEKLLGTPVEVLEKMSDKELEDYFSPVLHLTRPERQEKKTMTVSPTQQQQKGNFTAISRKAKLDAAMKMAQKLGIELDL